LPPAATGEALRSSGGTNEFLNSVLTTFSNHSLFICPPP
jgi:hypothetical protein